MEKNLELLQNLIGKTFEGMILKDSDSNHQVPLDISIYRDNSREVCPGAFSGVASFSRKSVFDRHDALLFGNVSLIDGKYPHISFRVVYPKDTFTREFEGTIVENGEIHLLGHYLTSKYGDFNGSPRLVNFKQVK